MQRKEEGDKQQEDQRLREQESHSKENEYLEKYDFHYEENLVGFEAEIKKFVASNFGELMSNPHLRLHVSAFFNVSNN